MPSPPIHAEDLLRAREARGLFWSLVARLFFISVAIALVAGHLLRLVSPGIAAQSDEEAYGMLAVQLVDAAFMLYFLGLARKRRKLLLVGLGAVVLDIAAVSLMPVIWYNTTVSPDGTLAYLMKNELFTMSILFVIINAVSMRPLYPAVAAGGFVLLQLSMAAAVLSDPNVHVSPNYMDHFYTEAVNPGITVLRVIVLALSGGFLSFLAWTARQTVGDAVSLEVANVELKERQAQMFFEGKMAALSALVAGLAHELNTPLGVLRSGLDVNEKAAIRVEKGTPPEAFSGLLRESGDATRRAVARIASVVDSLKDFARLDQAEEKKVDLRDGLESTLALIDPDMLGESRIVKEFDALPALRCRPKELNQVFMTLIINALEAMKGRGELRVKTSVERRTVRVSVADTGPGIPEEALDALFELRFHPRGGRMTMGLGLPTARRIVERHGGHLSVESILGAGSTFTVTLPLERS